ncbi:unnamed protein product, partial [Polarella glacialis]
DLTPFLAWLADGQEHNVTLQVFGNNPGGFWILDGVLLLRHGNVGTAISGGAVEVLQAGLPQVTQLARNESGSVSSVQTMRGLHSYHVRGNLSLAGGSVLESEVKGELAAWSRNRDL